MEGVNCDEIKNINNVSWGLFFSYYSNFGITKGVRQRMIFKKVRRASGD